MHPFKFLISREKQALFAVGEQVWKGSSGRRAGKDTFITQCPKVQCERSWSCPTKLLKGHGPARLSPAIQGWGTCGCCQGTQDHSQAASAHGQRGRLPWGTPLLGFGLQRPGQALGSYTRLPRLPLEELVTRERGGQFRATRSSRSRIGKRGHQSCTLALGQEGLGAWQLRALCTAEMV